MKLRRAAIVSPIRTPVGKFGGGLSTLKAGELGATILKALIDRSGIDPERVDDIVFGNGYPSGDALDAQILLKDLNGVLWVAGAPFALEIGALR